MLARSTHDIEPGESAELLLKTGDTVEARNATGRTIPAGRFVAVSETEPHRITHDLGDRR